MLRSVAIAIALVLGQQLCAQNAADSSPSQPAASLSVAGKWRNFLDETFNPLTVGAGVFNGGMSHLTNSDPKYGTDSRAFAAQFGASLADIASQNFFGDFVLASAFHEDPRYFRLGPEHSFWHRAGYAVSRAIVTRSDAGSNTFNWSNVLGTAMSAGLSNAYYPPASRTGGATAIHIGFGVVGAGLANLAPEFWPDFRQKFFKRRN